MGFDLKWLLFYAMFYWLANNYAYEVQIFKRLFGLVVKAGNHQETKLLKSEFKISERMI